MDVSVIKEKKTGEREIYGGQEGCSGDRWCGLDGGAAMSPLCMDGRICDNAMACGGGACAWRMKGRDACYCCLEDDDGSRGPCVSGATVQPAHRVEMFPKFQTVDVWLPRIRKAFVSNYPPCWFDLSQLIVICS